MNRLNELRKSRSVTLRTLGEKTNIIYSTLSEMETGKRKMSVKHAQKLAQYFDVSVDYLLGSDAINYVDSLEMGFRNLLEKYLENKEGESK